MPAAEGQRAGSAQPRRPPDVVDRVLDSRLAPVLVVAAITLGAAVLRIVVAGQDLFADELSTYWIISTNDLVGVVDTVSTTAEISPPLSFVLAWLATRIELTPELLRLPALVGGIATVPACSWSA